MATKTLLTIEDLLRLPDREGVIYELNKGELVTVTPPQLRHNRVRQKIELKLVNLVEERHLGEVTSDTGFILANDVMRVPDVAFITLGRSKDADPDQPVKGAPDLAVEIFSPNDRISELLLKVSQYLEAGAKVVWVAYPEKRQVHVFEPGEPPRLLNCDAILDCPEVLPGFFMPVSSLFE